MIKFRKANNIVGWIVFAISAVVYLLTIEPTASFWDCGEFIATAFKLEVGHPPGAPLFMMIARLFALFAPDVTKVAAMINAMSALASAFTILFLFWTITHLARKLLAGNGYEVTPGQLIAILGSGAVGALAYSFSDTFWFSAVEAEVYAMSSLFTAFVFWAILKWEEQADEPHSTRWLIFIAYIMGLSIGVHLLNLLTIPAIAFIYYFKKFKTSRNGILATLAISAIILGTILYIIIPGTFKIGSWFDLFFVNTLGLPYNSGLLFYFLLLFGALAYGIYSSHRKGKVVLNTIWVGVTVILIGYSSYMMIVIRAYANTPINENNPSNAFSLISYLNREQYGDRPLLYGQYYNAPVTDNKDLETWIPKDGKYVKGYLKTKYDFDDRFKTIFPRMYSNQPDHVAEYKKWANIQGKPVKINSRDGSTETRYVPTFSENLLFFFRYQIGHMYIRYFMWNFVGRQDDVQSHGGVENGNWISGIKPIDALFLGNQDNLTDDMKNHPSRNKYYFLPFILGLLGIYFQLKVKKDKRNFWVVFMLFFLTGIAIVMYLNQYPLQPRERDYAYAGSFYAFTIWIGLGVLAVFNWFRKKLWDVPSAITATAICMVVPVIMGVENWDDHDRSGRYIARDFAYNYLNSCEPNAILFTNGDNDTFPLWYAQEVEGIRTDVRVVNLSLLGTDWYIDQMKMKTYESAPLPISMKHDQYVMGTRDVMYIVNRLNEPVELKQLMDFVLSDDPAKKLRIPGDKPIDYLPTNKIKLTIDKAKILATGTVKEKDAHLIADTIYWTLKGQYITKSSLAILDIIANNNWERPIYFVSPYGDGNLGIADYLQHEGFAYRLVPIKSNSSDYLNVSRIDSDILYDRLMNRFRWGRINKPDVFIDHNVQRTAIVLKLRNSFSRLAKKLIEENKKDSALRVLDRVVELLPHPKFPYDFFMFGIIESYYKLNEVQKANNLALDYAKVSEQKLRFYVSLNDRMKLYYQDDIGLTAQTLQELASIAETYGQNEIAIDINKRIQAVLTIK